MCWTAGANRIILDYPLSLPWENKWSLPVMPVFSSVTVLLPPSLSQPEILREFESIWHSSRPLTSQFPSCFFKFCPCRRSIKVTSNLQRTDSQHSMILETLSSLDFSSDCPPRSLFLVHLLCPAFRSLGSPTLGPDFIASPLLRTELCPSHPPLVSIGWRSNLRTSERDLTWK